MAHLHLERIGSSVVITDLVASKRERMHVAFAKYFSSYVSEALTTVKHS